MEPVYEQDGGVDVAGPLTHGISEASFKAACLKGLRILFDDSSDLLCSIVLIFSVTIRAMSRAARLPGRVGSVEDGASCMWRLSAGSSRDTLPSAVQLA